MRLRELSIHFFLSVFLLPRDYLPLKENNRQRKTRNEFTSASELTTSHGLYRRSNKQKRKSFADSPWKRELGWDIM